MNILKNTVFRAILLSLALPLFAFVAGCDVDSVDSVTSLPSDNDGTIYNFSGLYVNVLTDTNDVEYLGPMVYPNEGNHTPSGELINSLRLLQYGSVLEAYDSAGLTWYGNLSTISGGTATFSLSGRTTVGSTVEISGTLIYAEQESTLNATWIEPTYYGNIFGTATVSPATTNSPISGLTVSANPTSLSLNGSSTITASGGSSTYTWPSSLVYGTIAVSTGSGSAIYTRTSGATGQSETISVQSGTESASVTISFN